MTQPAIGDARRPAPRPACLALRRWPANFESAADARSSRRRRDTELLGATFTRARASGPCRARRAPADNEGADAASRYWSNLLLSVPMPSMVTSTTFLASFMTPTPIEVPQQMTSPGSSVMSRDSSETRVTGGKYMSATG